VASRIDPRERSLVLPFALALAVHLALALAMPRNRPRTEPRPRVSELIEILPARSPPPPPGPVPALKRPPSSAKPAPRPRAPIARAPAQPAAALPSVATAADPAIVTPLDFTAEGSSSYAGTSRPRAVEVPAAAAAGPTPAGSGAGSDRSRGVSLSDGREWRCPFPSEADLLGIDHAIAQLRIEVGPDGRVRRIAISSDPGHGFGRAARTCAQSRFYEPALDRTGRPVASTLSVDVRFHR
jgi:protein TonB